MGIVTRTLIVLGHETRTVLKNWKLVLAAVAIPIVLTVVSNVSFGLPPEPADTLAIQDLDNTMLSQKVADQLRKWPNLKTQTVAASDQPSNLVMQSPNLVVVTVPQGLEAKVLTGASDPLQVTANRKGQRQSTIAFQAVSAAGVEIASVAAGVQAARLQAVRTGKSETVAARDAEINELKKLQINRVRVATTWIGKVTPTSTTFARQVNFISGPGIAFMELIGLILAFTMAGDIDNGRLRRLLWTPVTLAEVLAARSIVIFVMCGVVLAIDFGVSILFFSMPVGPSAPLLLAITTVITLAVTGYSLLIMGVGFMTRQVFQAMAAVLTVLLASLGGAFVPLGSLPITLLDIGRITPNSWASEGYRVLLLQGNTDSTLVTPVLALLLIGGVMAVAGVYLVRRSVYRI